MLEKIKYYLPMIALVVMILGVSYLSALDEKKTVQQVDVENGQTINELNK